MNPSNRPAIIAPEICPSCLRPINPHTSECRCSD